MQRTNADVIFTSRAHSCITIHVTYHCPAIPHLTSCTAPHVTCITIHVTYRCPAIPRLTSCTAPHAQERCVVHSTQRLHPRAHWRCAARAPGELKVIRESRRVISERPPNRSSTRARSPCPSHHCRPTSSEARKIAPSYGARANRQSSPGRARSCPRCANLRRRCRALAVSQPSVQRSAQSSAQRACTVVR